MMLVYYRRVMSRQMAHVLVVFGLIGLSIGYAPGAVAAPPVARIGFLGGSTAAQAAHLARAFRDGLRDLGYVEGRNLVIESRFADGKLDRLPALAKELVDLKVDVIFAPPTPAAAAAKKTTGAIPIVFALVADPVGLGLADSLAHPGGNCTGLSTVNAELGGKRLQLLREAFPKLRRIAVLYHPDDASNVLQLEQTGQAAKALGVQLLPLKVSGAHDFEPAFATLVRERADGVLVMENPINFTHRNQLVALVDRHRLPAMYALREFVDAGGLMSYSVSFPEQFRRAAIYVDKILKGARPGDLPVEQPTRIVFTVNNKAVQAFGSALPASLLLRADEVIR